MEERLQKALEFANYRQTLNNQLHKIKIKTEGLLIFSKNGGNFAVNQELICFLDYLVRSESVNATILDSNNTPVRIEDIPAFLKEITARYFEVTNEYSREYQAIKKLRNVKSIIGIKDDE
jgi:hypothetical protein